MPRSKIAKMIETPEQALINLQDVINQNIRQLMAYYNLNDKDVAERAVICQSNFSNKLNGKQGYTILNLISIAKVFDVNVVDLLIKKAPPTAATVESKVKYEI